MIGGQHRWAVASPLTAEALGIPGERARYAIRKQIIAKKLNQTLLPAMRRHGIDVFFHRHVPTNDGGISLGQAVCAASLHKQANPELAQKSTRLSRRSSGTPKKRASR